MIMIDYIKDIINFLSGPTISFSLLTLMSPFLFPPTDWFEKYHFNLFELNVRRALAGIHTTFLTSYSI